MAYLYKKYLEKCPRKAMAKDVFYLAARRKYTLYISRSGQFHAGVGIKQKDELRILIKIIYAFDRAVVYLTKNLFISSQTTVSENYCSSILEHVSNDHIMQ